MQVMQLLALHAKHPRGATFRKPPRQAQVRVEGELAIDKVLFGFLVDSIRLVCGFFLNSVAGFRVAVNHTRIVSVHDVMAAFVR